jgi:ketosteroid isomerase-like protein
MSTGDVADVIEQSHRALDQFVQGNSTPYQALFSHQDDACLANPWGPAVCGWEQVRAAMERGAVHFRDGHSVGFERLATYSTPHLVCMVEVERYQAKLDGQETLTPIALRVTSVLQVEGGAWRIVHRHADPITAAQTAASLIEA